MRGGGGEKGRGKGQRRDTPSTLQKYRSKSAATDIESQASMDEQCEHQDGVGEWLIGVGLAIVGEKESGELRSWI